MPPKENNIIKKGRLLEKNLSDLYDNREANTISRLVLEKITGKRFFELSFEKESCFSQENNELFLLIQLELMKGVPLQYVLNESWFRNSLFYVNQDVLIPRSETEELVDWVLSKAKKGDKILEIGVGSGCICISLQLEGPGFELTGTDVSKEALKVAKKNSETHNCTINFIQDDISNSNLNYPSNLDIIVSNPPYIPIEEGPYLPSNVLSFEPKKALFTPENDPLYFYSIISKHSYKWLNINGLMFFEIHENFSNEVVEMMQKDGFKNVVIKKDIHDRPRMVLGEKS